MTESWWCSSERCSRFCHPLDRRASALGLTSYEFALLETIADAERARLRLARLARSTSATLPRLSRVVTALERKGLVERVRSEDGARATDAVLTPAGRTAVNVARPLMELAVQQLVLDPLTPDQRECMTAAIRAILATVDPDRQIGVVSAART